MTLAAARADYATAVAQGLEDKTCRRGQPNEIIISNGGPRLLIVATGRATLGAAHDRNCWSPAADAFYETLSHIFERYHADQPPF